MAWLAVVKGIAEAALVADAIFGDSPNMSNEQRKVAKAQREQYRKQILSAMLRAIAALDPALATRLIREGNFRQNFLDTEKFWMEDAVDLSSDSGLLNSIEDIGHVKINTTTGSDRHPEEGIPYDEIPKIGSVTRHPDVNDAPPQLSPPSDDIRGAR
jgi:hypothetical protein